MIIKLLDHSPLHRAMRERVSLSNINRLLIVALQQARDELASGGLVDINPATKTTISTINSVLKIAKERMG